MYVFSKQLRQDPDHYGIIAKHLAQHGCYCFVAAHPTAFRPPLYPLLLAPWSAGGQPAVLGVVVLHLILSLMIVSGVYVLGFQWCDQRAGLVAALIAALDPLLIMQSTLVMTETLAAALAVVALTALSRLNILPNHRSAILAGVAVGLAILCRPTFLFWVPLIAIGVVFILRSRFAQRLRFAAVLIASVLVVLLPWFIRNWIVLGHPIVATTHGGYTLWLANNDAYYDFLLGKRPDFSASILDEQQRAVLRDSNFDEVLADRRYQQLALDTMQRRPAAFAYSCLRRMAKLWHPLPERRTPNESALETWLRRAAGVWYVLVYVAAVGGMLRVRKQLLANGWYWGVSLCLAFMLVHTFYWTDIRMRAPLIPVVALLAAALGAKRVRCEGLSPVERS